MIAAIRIIYRHFKIYLQCTVCPKRAGVANLLLEKDNKLDLLQLSGFAPAIRLNHDHLHCQDNVAELLKMKLSHNFWWF